ncbi:GNAT family N-acetyltransferase [Streptomyces sp. RB6PN25]|uniref:GNAT family N-acetyltransferase n=1 Tax=Streptomyces humicola TaxID=2953240 RepID=A0ABT1Q4M1_9ACTN|nr:GNAT family N-acetyltransferase [Streptomyces humicola]MCQ4083707.1 GNAT family N-acetyltransferase [Streptomyces humicola]
MANIVAQEPDGAVVGWACLGPYREENASTTQEGGLYALYVRPDRIGHGFGRTLTEAALDHANAQGFPWVRLWVLEGNARARRFYERAGFAPDGGLEPFVVDGVPVPEVRYARRLGGAAR